MESTTGYTFTPCVGYFTSPGIDTRYKGPTVFSVSSERHKDSVEGITLDSWCLLSLKTVYANTSWPVSVNNL